MSITKKIVMIIVALILVCVIGILIIASPWIILAVGLWLSPAPPKPEITYGEFDFKLVYEIDGEIQTIEDTIICEFDGFNIDEASGKTRRWKEEFKNEQGNELYAFRVEQIDNPEFNEYKNGRKPDYNQIVLKNIDHYKVLLSVADAEYFLDEPDDKTQDPIEPSIKVGDTNIYSPIPDVPSNLVMTILINIPKILVTKPPISNIKVDLIKLLFIFPPKNTIKIYAKNKKIFKND